MLYPTPQFAGLATADGSTQAFVGDFKDVAFCYTASCFIVIWGTAGGGGGTNYSNNWQ